MMVSRQRCSGLAVALAVLLPVGVALAVPEAWVEWTWAPGDWVSTHVTPAATGPALDAARLADGTVVDGRLTLQLWLQSDMPPDDPPPPAPVPNYPAEDMWLQPQGDQGPICPGRQWIPDGPTDADGWTTFSGPFAGGGGDDGNQGGLLVFVAGQPLENRGGPLQAVPIRFNSPDIDGDGHVNLADVTLFATDYRGAYDYRSDLVWDGVLDLTDVTVFAQAAGEACD